MSERNDMHAPKCALCPKQSVIVSNFSRLPCKHAFHSECLSIYCLTTARNSKINCPECKLSISVKKINDLTGKQTDTVSLEKNNDIDLTENSYEEIDTVGLPSALPSAVTDNKCSNTAIKATQLVSHEGNTSVLDNSAIPFIPCENHTSEQYGWYCCDCSLPLCIECLEDHSGEQHAVIEASKANDLLAEQILVMATELAAHGNNVNSRTRASVEELITLPSNILFLSGQQINASQLHINKHTQYKKPLKRNDMNQTKLKQTLNAGTDSKTAFDFIFKPFEMEINEARNAERVTNVFLNLNSDDSDDNEASNDLFGTRLPTTLLSKTPNRQLEIPYDPNKKIVVEFVQTLKFPSDIPINLDIVAVCTKEDELFLLNADTKEVIVLSLEMHLLRRIGRRHLQQPSGMVIMPNKEHIAVADGNFGVKILHMKTGDLISALPIGFDGIAADVAVTPGGKLIIADVKKHIVAMLDEDNDPCLLLESEPSGRPQFVHPAHVVFNELEGGQIIVRDTGSKRVKIFSADRGRCRFFYPSITSSKDQPGRLSSDPGGLCVDANGRILIIDPRFRNVHVVSSVSGQYLGRMDLQRLFKRDPPPTMISVTDAGMMLVASRDGYFCLFLYELHE